MHNAKRYLNTERNESVEEMEKRKCKSEECRSSEIRRDRMGNVVKLTTSKIENSNNEICVQKYGDVVCDTQDVSPQDTSHLLKKSSKGRIFNALEAKKSKPSSFTRKQACNNDQTLDNNGKQEDDLGNANSKPSNVKRPHFKKKQTNNTVKSVNAKKKYENLWGSLKKRDKGHLISSSERCRRHEGNVKFRCDFPSTQAKVMLARGWKQVHSENIDWDLWWCETADVRQALDMRLESHQKIPHFRNHYELTRKNYLCRNLKRYKKFLLKSKKVAEAALCDSMPITFELPNDYKMFVEEYQKQQGATWIVKPVGRSQGKGIFLFRRLKDLAEWKAREQSNNLPLQPETPLQTFVVQKYVDDPYLLAGRKFDLRIYVLVTSFHPLRVWLAREGFARLSGELFDLKNIDNSRVHLTNVAIQLRNIGNGAGEEKVIQYKWALVKIIKHLVKSHGRPVVWNLLRRIAGVIMASLLAVQPVIMQGKNSFELYGYDVLLDECLTPWLLEVNASPALTGTDSEDYRLKFDLIDDVLNILDFEARFSGREIRIGGFDLLWDDGPIWITYPCTASCSETEAQSTSKRLNIFLGAKNDREEQLRRLQEVLSKKCRQG